MGGPEDVHARFDEIDRELIFALQRDGRASYARLAEIVGLSQTAVRSRVQRLLDSGALQISGVVDPNAFGFAITAMICMTYTGNLDVLAEAISRMDQAHFVVLTGGRYDCLAEVVCVDNDDLFSLINNQIRAIEGVKDVEVVSYLRFSKFQPKFPQFSRDQDTPGSG
jgi:Lrp/AsnC family transcriptional regulator for asnA, asnC and gidA